MLPQDQAESLFARFRINDSESQFAIYRYRPLRRLYNDQGVDESWKRKAAKRMHAVIQREQKWRIKLRPKQEGAVESYRQILHALVYGENLPISKEFYQEEIAFMLDVETKKPIVQAWSTGRVMDLLDDREVRHKFARRQVLSGEFWVYDGERAATARRIIEEFAEDLKLKNYLEEQLSEYQIRSKQERLQKEQRLRAEQELLQRMKLSSV